LAAALDRGTTTRSRKTKTTGAWCQSTTWIDDSFGRMTTHITRRTDTRGTWC
jgi:hypothetical protein